MMTLFVVVRVNSKQLIQTNRLAIAIFNTFIYHSTFIRIGSHYSNNGSQLVRVHQLLIASSQFNWNEKAEDN
mgnify:FL=1